MIALYLSIPFMILALAAALVPILWAMTHPGASRSPAQSLPTSVRWDGSSPGGPPATDVRASASDGSGRRAARFRPDHGRTR